PAPPPMQTMVRLIGSLGGWLGRKCDDEPGPKAMWVGMQRMTDLAQGWRARAEQPAPTGTNRPGSRRRRESKASGNVPDTPIRAGPTPAAGGWVRREARRHGPNPIRAGPTSSATGSPCDRRARRSGPRRSGRAGEPLADEPKAHG